MQAEIKVQDGYYVIRIPIAQSYDDRAIRELLDTLKVQEILSRSQASEDQVHGLAEKLQATWWRENKGRFLGKTDP